MIKDIKEPWIINNFFSDSAYRNILNYLNSLDINIWQFEKSFSRYTYESKYLDKISLLNMDLARKEFNSNTLLHTYSMVSLYNNDKSFLPKHKDNNACTYTFDICLYADNPWPIIVEDKEYILKNNQALCFYGEDQEHWRPPFIRGNKVLMMFMHWAEPDHLFFQDAGEI